MNLGITQLAFNSSHELEDLAPLLSELKIQNLEIIPFRMNSKEDSIIKISKKYDLTLGSSQSILFGSDIKDFLQEDFPDYIVSVFNRFSNLNTNVLVLGSPGQRKSFEEDRLSIQFHKIDKSLSSNSILCIEPNCQSYGGGYFFTVSEIADFIRKNRFTNIRTMIDTHNIINEGQSPSQIFEEFADLIHHVHVSENELSSFQESEEHRKLAKSLKEFNYRGIITYEVKPQSNLEESLKQFKSIYE